MARPLRLVFPNAIYHVTSRGNARRTIFLDDKDRVSFLRIFESVVGRFGWVCYAYCLMGNHYHLLLETPQPNISLGMRQLNGVYTQWFNRRHKKTGHLLEGRFKAILVQRGGHLLELVRYVVLNPLRAHLVSHPSQYSWTSYRATMGLTPNSPLIDSKRVLDLFGDHPASARQSYSRFVMEGLKDRPWDRLVGQIYFGDEKFAHSLPLPDRHPEIPRVQQEPIRLPLATLLAKPDGVVTAYRTYGYRLREIAESLGVHYSTVSRRLKGLESICQRKT